MGAFIRLLAPLVSFLPKLQKPHKRIAFKEKLLWTIFGLIYFLIASQIPLYGMEKLEGEDSMDFLRMMTASNRGTLMELGISPIISASMIMHLLEATKLISVDMNDEYERSIFESLQNLFGLVMTLAQSIIQLTNGQYGDVEAIGMTNCVLIVAQLFISGLIVLMLDELLSSEYGFGSAISLFIATNISESVVWALFSPLTYNNNGVQFEGAIINLVHSLFTRPDKLNALYDAFFRANMPNMINVIATVVMLAIVVYFSDFKVNIPLAFNNSQATPQPFSVKLFYTSITPLYMSSTLIQMITMVSRSLFVRFPTSFIVNLIGSWQVLQKSSTLKPVGGIIYYLQRPHSFTEVLFDPLHALVSICISMFIAAFFSYNWLNIGRMGPHQIKQQLAEQRLHIKGFRGGQSSYHLLDHYIPIAATLGAMILSAIAILADLLGCIGSGTGLLLAANTITEYYDKFQKDYKKSTGSNFVI